MNNDSDSDSIFGPPVTTPSTKLPRTENNAYGLEETSKANNMQNKAKQSTTAKRALDGDVSIANFSI